MFTMLDTECVLLCVIVTRIVGIGSFVFAIGTELVGYMGEAVFLVIFVPGMGCMGAYRVAPVCIVYSTSNILSAGCALAASPLLVSSFESGPFVPETFLSAVATVSSNLPVMPLMEKRSE